MQFRWMFCFERQLGKLKSTVRNKARVEGCITEAFALKEICHFSSKYFESKNLKSKSLLYHQPDSTDK